METIGSTQLNRGRLDTGKLILQFTVLFAVVTAGIFAVLAVFNKSLMEFNDAYKQGYFLICELRHGIESLLSGNGFPLWSWSKGMGMPVDLPADPFSIIAALFPERLTELGFSIASALRLYCGGLAFLIFARNMESDDFKCLLGSVCYIYTAWFINTAIIQSSFLVGSYMMPLLVLGVEYVYKDRNPALFICSVAYYLMRDAYAAYMAAIAVIIYMLLRYFAYNERFVLSDYLKRTGQFVAYALIGAAIAMVYLIQTITSVFNASTESGKEGTDILFSPDFYIGLGKHFTGSGVTGGYTFLGISVLAVMVLPVAFRHISLKKTNVIMTGILLVMMLFPVFSRMFNGFSYSSARWYFLIIFFAVWTAVEYFDIKLLMQKQNMMIMAITLGVLTVSTLGFHVFGVLDLSLRTMAFILIYILAGVGILAAIFVWKRKGWGLHSCRCTIIAVCALALAGGWSLSFYANIDSFIGNGEVMDQLEKSTQRVSGDLAEDDFGRTDQVEWINVHNGMDMPANENLYWQSNSIYQYDSMITGRQLEYNRLTGNNYGYLMRVYTLSNGNRMGLDYLSGVRYFLGDDTANGGEDADRYAGYGFSFQKNMDGINVYASRHETGLGFAYDKWMRESEFRKLGRMEREQALMEAAVIRDEDADRLTCGEEITASEADTDVKKIPFEIRSKGNTEIVQSEGKRTISSSGEKVRFTICAETDEDCQLVVSFDNLQKKDEAPFTVKCTDGSVTKQAGKLNTNQSVPGIADFDLNMGHQDGFDGELEVTISASGEYTCDSIHVYGMPAALFDEKAESLEKHRYVVESYSWNNVKGKVDAADDGIMYFSIPQYGSWEVYVDGEKADRIDDVNIAFMGVEIGKGSHEVELRYSSRLMVCGLIISIAGLEALGIICLLRYRKRRKTTLQEG